MASATSSAPPKFVPTLTDEVALPADSSEQQALAEPVEVPGGYELPGGVADEDEELETIVRPLDMDAIPELDMVVEPEELVPEVHNDIASIPVVSDVVDESDVEPTIVSRLEPDRQTQQTPPIAPEPMSVAVAQPAPLPDGYEEYVVHRVMQRVDVLLEQRLREAIALVIQEQTRSIVPRLREEVEAVVRQSVYEAVADELALTAK